MLNKKGIDAAVKSSDVADKTFKASQDEYEKENYLIVDISNIQWGIDTTTTIFYNLKNFGKYPIKLDSAYSAWIVRTVPPAYNEMFPNDAVYLPYNMIITNELLDTLFTNYNRTVSREITAKVMSGKYNLYFFGAFKYTNLAIGKKKIFRVVMQFNGSGNRRNPMNYIYNQQSDIDN